MQGWRIRQEPRWLHDRLTLEQSTSRFGAVLALITMGQLYSWYCHEILHRLELPRGGVSRMLVQEIVSIFELLPVHLDHELEVCCSSFPSDPETR